MTTLPCAIYTRKSSEEGLEQGFNSLDAQREACEAYILSQKSQGWKLFGAFDDGGFSGGNVDRPGLRNLLAAITARKVRVVVVYKVDRLTRSLADFAKLVELFDAHDVSFVSVTQAFNTTTSMGRLTLNVLLSFAQFEREVTGERIRDKIAASKKKGMWMGGLAPIGYLPHERTLVIDEPNAGIIREIFNMYLKLGSVYLLKAELDAMGWKTPHRPTKGPGAGGAPYSRGHLYRILSNAIYIGQIVHKGATYPGQHEAIIDMETWGAAQAKLAENLQGHVNKSRAQAPSLLCGLVFDQWGNRLSPSHTKKGNKRYRYYIRQETAEQSALRIPAQELESPVIGALIDMATDQAKLLQWLKDEKDLPAKLRQAAQTAERLKIVCVERAGLVNRLVARVTVMDESIALDIRARSIWCGDGPVASEEGENIHTISIPTSLKRCGPSVRLVVQSPDAKNHRGPDAKLVNLLDRARRWFDSLKSGHADSILTIAHQQGMESRDVTRVIYLAFLAPDIVQRIVRGDHSPDLNMKKLLSLAPLPLDWTDQRRLLGMET